MTIHTRFLSLITDRGLAGSWMIKVLGGYRRPPFNKGAGYIGGFTAFITYGARNQGDMYRPAGLQIGITRNANRVPWLAH